MELLHIKMRLLRQFQMTNTKYLKDITQFVQEMNEQLLKVSAL